MKITKKRWSLEQIWELLHLHRARTPIKVMALKHDTTPNAIQKVLQKYKRLHAKGLLKKPPHHKSAYSYGFQQSPEWTSFEDVMLWMIQQKMDVQINTQTRFAVHFPYRVGKRYMTAFQVLVEANKQRLRVGLPIFWVQGISHEDV